MLRGLTTYSVVFALLVQSVLAPVALAEAERTALPAPTPAPTPVAENSDERQVRDIEAAAAEIDHQIDLAAIRSKEPTARQDAAEAHATNHAVADEIVRLERKGLLARVKGVSPADWFRYVLTGFKSITKMVYVGKTESWSNGALASSAGVGSMLTGGAIEVVATAFEFPINELSQNFPINANKIPETKFWRKFFTQSFQGAFWRSLLYSGIVPTTINTLNAVNDPAKTYPSLTAAGIGWATGFMLSLTYGLGYLGTGFLEKLGYLKSWIRNVGFALTGMVGYYGGLKLLNGGDASTQYEVLQMMIPVWLAYATLGVSGIYLDKRNEAKKKDDKEPVLPNPCPDHIRLLARKGRR